MDLFVNDSNDIASGNMRRREQDQLNEAISDHNNQVSRNINDVQKQLQDTQSKLTQQEAFSQIAGGVQDLMGIKGIHKGLQSYKEWSNNRATKTQRLSDMLSEGEGDNGNIRVGDTPQSTPEIETPPDTTPEPPPTSTPEGSSAVGNNPAPTVEEHEAVTVGEDGAGKSGSMVHNGLKTISGLSDDAIDKVGKCAGVLSAGVTGGLDIYKDIKAGGIAGDNGFEKAGNITQIGGAVSDVLGTVFPPAELLGGVLDLIGGGLDAIGEAVEGSKTKAEAKQKAQEQTEQQEKQQQGQVQISQPPQVALARTQ